MVSTNKHLNINTGNYTIANGKWKNLLDVKIHLNLNINDHISDLCKKASRKISALARTAPFMNFDKRKLLMNAFFISHFNCFPLIWMCHSRTNSRKIKMLYETCLRIIYNDKQSSFNELLNKGSSVSIRIRNIQRLAIEMFKFYKELPPPTMYNDSSWKKKICTT